jgi:nitrogen regulatory protein P-II 1
MQLVVAIIQPTKVSVVRDALASIGVTRLTICDAQGYGRHRGQLPTYRGIEYQVNLLRKVAIEVTVNDDFLERTLETLVLAARSGPEGQIGDGKIFVLPVEETIEIGPGRRGPEAV